MVAQSRSMVVDIDEKTELAQAFRLYGRAARCPGQAQGLLISLSALNVVPMGSTERFAPQQIGLRLAGHVPRQASVSNGLLGGGDRRRTVGTDEKSIVGFAQSDLGRAPVVRQRADQRPQIRQVLLLRFPIPAQVVHAFALQQEVVALLVFPLRKQVQSAAEIGDRLVVGILRRRALSRTP